MTSKEYFETQKVHNKAIRDLDEILELVIQEIMVGFAQEHVQEALASASNNVTAHVSPSYDFGYHAVINRDSIRNAYPIDNIK